MMTKHSRKTLPDPLTPADGLSPTMSRLAFAAMLENYVPPRPKLYRDRKWLEGYSETARAIARGYNGCQVFPRAHAPTAFDAGVLDAWLDAIGC